MTRFLVCIRCALLAMTVVLALGPPAVAQQQRPLKIGLVTFLSGPGAATFGKAHAAVPKRLGGGAQRSKVPPPYQQRGFGGNAAGVGGN